MTHHQHVDELERLAQRVRDGEINSERAAQTLLDEVAADVPATERTEYVDALRAHAKDGVGHRIVEQVAANLYPEHPTP